MPRNETPPINGYELLGRTLALLAFFPAVAAQFILGGVVIYEYWQWFVVPVYAPAVSPGVLQFIGLAMFGRVFFARWQITRNKADWEKKLERGVAETIVIQLLAVAFALGIGWLLKTYVIGPDPSWLAALVN